MENYSFFYWLYQRFLATLIIRIFEDLMKNSKKKEKHLTIIFTTISYQFTIDLLLDNKRFKRNKLPRIRLFIHNSLMFYLRMINNSKLGLAESYMFSEWDTDTSTKDFLSLLISLKRNKKFPSAKFNTNDDAACLLKNLFKKLFWILIKFQLKIIIYLLELRYSKYKNIDVISYPNTLEGSRQNIREHYDLGNDLFKKFLDKSMTYSCAIFKVPDNNVKDMKVEHLPSNYLYEAQMHKHDTVLNMLNLTKNSNVLEVGCGWGSLAILAAQKFKCKWTGITISLAQLNYAKKIVKEAKCDNNVTLKFLDYREETGTYDNVVAIEMIEAVGQDYLSLFFQTMSNRLVTGGKLVIQAIICRDEEYNKYCTSTDFIKKHIFPGGHMPSLSAIKQALPDKLKITNVCRIGHHYSPTLDFWCNSWRNARNSIMKMGYSLVFFRMWEMYFSLCSALFAHRNIDVVQIIMVKSCI